MSEQTGREWRFYIDDMIAFIEKVANYTEGSISTPSFPAR